MVRKNQKSLASMYRITMAVRPEDAFPRNNIVKQIMVPHIRSKGVEWRTLFPAELVDIQINELFSAEHMESTFISILLNNHKPTHQNLYWLLNKILWIKCFVK